MTPKQMRPRFISLTLSTRAELRNHTCDIELSEGSVILDFDADDKLLGIEILGASRLLPEDMLKDSN